MPAKRPRSNENSEYGQSDTIETQSPSFFCNRCQQDALPNLRKIFFPKKGFSSGRPRRIMVGNIVQSIQQEQACLLCKFFVETLQLYPKTFRIYGETDTRQTNIALVLDGQPWFKMAGIATELQPCEFCWLQIGSEVEAPLICVSLDPLEGSRAGFQQRDDRIHPTRREPVKAFNGSFDHRMVSKWLDKCDRHHGLCTPHDTIMPKDLMLIDVGARCIVPYEAGAQFLTLSYVWGKGVQQQQYYVERKRTKNPCPANHEIPQVLPQTIEDAIQITKKLGKRYLWVDLLCIDQADEIGKQDQIEAMDKIYASSWLTLVCVDGPDAMYGLPGESRNMTQTKQPSVLTPIGRFIATYVHSHWDQDGKTEWDQRAWTMQERLVSQRCLFFADTYLSMICKEEVFHDLISANLEDPKKILALDHMYFREDGSSINLDLSEWDFDTYANLVSVFTGRRLTDQNDVHNACQGSLNRLSLRTGCEFHFGIPKSQNGIPTSDLLQGLLWIPHNEYVLSKRAGFPTWSWLGWIGRSEYSYWLHWQNKDHRTHNFSPDTQRRWDTNTADFIRRNQVQLADIIHDSTMTAPVIQLKTSILRCNVQLAYKHGELFRSSRTRKPEPAKGDQWRLLRRDGSAIPNQVGEYQDFQSSCVSFRVHPDQSRDIQRARCQVDLIFIKYWRCIWDSKKYLPHMVSALVVLRDQQGCYHRLASVVISANEWLEGEYGHHIATLI